MGNLHDDKENIESRQAIVDTLDLLEFKPCEIYEKVKDRYQKYDDSRRVMYDDLKAVRTRRKNLLFDGDRDRAIQNYIGQQLEIFKRALAKESFGSANVASTNVARARGVEVENLPAIINNFFNRVEHTEVNFTEILNSTPEGSDKTMGELWRGVLRKERIEDKSELVSNS